MNQNKVELRVPKPTYELAKELHIIVGIMRIQRLELNDRLQCVLYDRYSELIRIPHVFHVLGVFDLDLVNEFELVVVDNE
jgi:hypothetical protein